MLSSKSPPDSKNDTLNIHQNEVRSAGDHLLILNRLGIFSLDPITMEYKHLNNAPSRGIGNGENLTFSELTGGYLYISAHYDSKHDNITKVN